MFAIYTMKVLFTVLAYLGWVMYLTQPMYCKGCKEELMAMKCSGCGRKQRVK